MLSWCSYKSKCPLRFIGATESIAAGEAIDQGNILELTTSLVFGANIPLHIVLNFKDLSKTSRPNAILSTSLSAPLSTVSSLTLIAAM